MRLSNGVAYKWVLFPKRASVEQFVGRHVYLHLLSPIHRPSFRSRFPYTLPQRRRAPKKKSGFSSMATVVKETAPGALPAPLPDVPVHVDARPDLNAESEDSDSDFEDEELYEDILAADMEDWEYGDGISNLVFPFSGKCILCLPVTSII